MPERHRTLRCPFVAGVKVTDQLTGEQIAAHTENLSAYGCFIETITPFSAETKVKLQISRDGQRLVAQGKVAYSRPHAGMGIAFVSFEPGCLTILDEWLDELRTR
jgi:hypothetical protein